MFITTPHYEAALLNALLDDRALEVALEDHIGYAFDRTSRDVIEGGVTPPRKPFTPPPPSAEKIKAAFDDGFENGLESSARWSHQKVAERNPMHGVELRQAWKEGWHAGHRQTWGR